MRVIIESDYQALSQWAANYVAKRINQAKTYSRKTVYFGLAYRFFPSGYV